MGEVMRLFGKSDQKNNLVKVLNRNHHRNAAMYIIGLSDVEYQAMVPKLNNVIQTSESVGIEIAVAIKELEEVYGTYNVAAEILGLAADYAEYLKEIGMSTDASIADLARLLKETRKLNAVAQYLEGNSGNKG